MCGCCFSGRQMHTVLGIDPGVSGAIVVMTPKDGVLVIYDMPTVELRAGKGKRRWVDAHQLKIDLEYYASFAHAFLEDVWPRPLDSKISAFTFGHAVGVVEGVLATLDIPWSPVSPQRWTRDLRVGKGKDASRSRASELMPAAARLWQGKTQHNRAEAALIGYWGVYKATSVATSSQIKPHSPSERKSTATSGALSTRRISPGKASTP